MHTKGIFRILLILSIIVTNIGCDQVSKKIVRNKMAADENISFIGNHLTVTRVENSGAFLSLGDALPRATKNILLSVLPLLILAFVFVYTLTKNTISPIPLTGLCFIIGGGIGNIFDRLVYGSVTDFLHIDFGIFRTGIFNMADVSIVAGTLIILFYSFFKRRQLRQPSPQENML
jgi:signal peptidase II